MKKEIRGKNEMKALACAALTISILAGCSMPGTNEATSADEYRALLASPLRSRARPHLR
jgi:ABC-type uncharacterized transport system auxiliary subunit